MTKKNIMKHAHAIAKQIVGVCEDYQIALQFGLKYVWNMVNQFNAKRMTKRNIARAVWALTKNPASEEKTTYNNYSKDNENVGGVPAWIIRKNLNQNEAYAVLNECSGLDIVRETAKAILVKFDTPYGYIEMWSPKSVLVAA